MRRTIGTSACLLCNFRMINRGLELSVELMRGGVVFGRRVGSSWQMFMFRARDFLTKKTGQIYAGRWT